MTIAQSQRRPPANTPGRRWVTATSRKILESRQRISASELLFSGGMTTPIEHDLGDLDHHPRLERPRTAHKKPIGHPIGDLEGLPGIAAVDPEVSRSRVPDLVAVRRDHKSLQLPLYVLSR